MSDVANTPQSQTSSPDPTPGSGTWFITGVSSGFGRHLTKQLLARGDRVAGTVRRVEAVADLVDRYGDRFWVDVLDLTDFDRIRTTVDAAFTHFGRIETVVNNAGYGLFGAAEEASDAQVLHHLQTNLLGSVQVARSALPHLRHQAGGHLVQISSYGGQATNPGASLYHAGKWGIEGFMDSVAKEVAPFGVRVTIVEPGGARTEFRFSGLTTAQPLAAYDGTPAAMTRGAGDRSRPSLGDPQKMAAAIIAAVERPDTPRRLVLGSDSYRFITTALRERLAEVEVQEASAAATDWQE